MALPSTNDLSLWSGNKLTNTQWDANATKLIQFLSSGTWDLKINNLDCNNIDASSINVNITNGVPTGAIVMMSTTYAPTGYLRANGANHLIANYENLFFANGHTYGPGDGTVVTPSGVTVVGNVCTVTAVGHGLANGSYVSVKFTDVAIAVVINRGAKIENVSANTFDFSVVGWLEQPVSPLTFTPATTFPVADWRGRFGRDVDTTATWDPDAASRLNRGDGATGAQVGTTQTDSFQGHHHNIQATNYGIVDSGSPGAPWSAINTTGVGYNFNSFLQVEAPISDTVNGTPRVSSQTRGINISAYFYVKT